MGIGASNGSRARRLVRLVCVLATAAMLAAPMLLGPAITPLVRALGEAPQHHCACGMEPGKCGCPECEHRAEQDHEYPVLKSSCDDDGQAPLAFGALPAGVPGPSLALGVGYDVGIGELGDVPVAVLTPRDRVRPPTPPPRG
jgi:hypothetical protein